ncbi:MAG TPA: hypothetical protein VNE41_08920 [Chitinophagaceae bacterium]|nr:hypothetical protein [Chitinophagaceae bacterium]
MKKYLLYPSWTCLMLMCIISPGDAQQAFRIGLTAGYGLDGESYQASGTTGGYVAWDPTFSSLAFPFGGLVANVDIHGPLFLQPEFLLSAFGVRVQDQTYGNYRKGIVYVKVPLDIMYQAKAGPGCFLIGAGPYFARAVYGQSRGGKIAFGNSATDVMKAGDWGIDMRAEYIFNMGFLISLDYDVGIENLVPSAQSGTIHNDTWDISIGILFHRKK